MVAVRVVVGWVVMAPGGRRRRGRLCTFKGARALASRARRRFGRKYYAVRFGEVVLGPGERLIGMPRGSLLVGDVA